MRIPRVPKFAKRSAPPPPRGVNPGLRRAVRAAGYAGIAAAIVVPHVRRMLKVPTTVTVASTVAAPLAIAVLWPRTRTRDVALFGAQMWAFAVSHELPYDDPDRLRERLRVEYPIKIDRFIGRGRLPNSRLQDALHDTPVGPALTRFSVLTHWFWFAQPHIALAWILVRHNRRFPHAARQMAAVFDIGCALYFAVPTAPPWWAAENGYIGDERVRRAMIEFGERFWGPVWARAFGTLASNPWAAMPSLHFATALMAAILLGDAGGKVERRLGWAYAGSLAFALVYLGEHYVTDLLAGAAVVAVVRRGEPLARPLVLALNRRIQRVEAIATGA